MVSPLAPRRLRKLVRHLRRRGFSVRISEPRHALFGPRRMLLESKRVDVWVMWDRGWYVYAGAYGVTPAAMNVWRACLEQTEVRSVREGPGWRLEWQFDYLDDHLEAMETALAPERLVETKRCLAEKQRDYTGHLFSAGPDFDKEARLWE